MVTFAPTWGEHALETDVFKYTIKEFVALRQVTLALSSLSLVFSTLIIAVYIYMLMYHRKQANRVSLRCVFLCSVADLLNATLSICITNQRGDSQFCRASSVIIEFANIWSATLLTLVGLNLVLIFVVNVKRRDLLEKLYYPCAVAYTFAGVAMPIHQQATKNLRPFEHYSCWYLKYVEDRTNNIMPWMWYYGFIFFVNIIAVCCSIMAMIKLIQEQRSVQSRMHTINANSEFTSKQTGRHLNKTVRQRHNNVFSKVVMRCTIYPLIPFLANIFGFILQMLITATKKTPSYTLAMLDIVFSCLEGMFVAGVFFTDPAITSFMSSTYAGWYEKYVEQYTWVPQADMKAAPASSPYSSPCGSSQTMKPPTAAAVKDNQHSLNAQYPSTQPVRKKPPAKIKAVVMRRVHFDTDHHNRIRQHQQIRQLSTISFDIATLSPVASVSRHHDRQPPSVAMPTISSTRRDIYLPYRFPFFATCFHYMLTRYGRKHTADTFETSLTTTTAHTQSTVDTFTSNDIPISANSSPSSSTVIVITEDC
ncbi:hypothetical protein MAM1_0159d06881 [Mucor ambiguus]|uniref:G-protein coupled receptors family 2 profile 2 domain-containing protein n=1 Tax=Mucor ambiguus TaxID=91626 RepID=A0A0C9MIZ3_9FUNG|nr:hypothetical protein MAM1_0159d06881 [Mucor ambiguus]